MNKNVDFLEEKIENVSLEDMIFIDDIISENKIIINMPLIDVVGNDLTRAAMLTRYMFFYKHNNYQAFSQSDKQISDFLRTNIKTIERQKRWLKENGFISVKKIGIPAVDYITVNIEKVTEILVNFKKYQIDTSGKINSTLHIYNNKINNNILSNVDDMRPLQDGAKSTNLIGAGAPTINKEIYKDNIKENIKRKTDQKKEKGGK